MNPSPPKVEDCYRFWAEPPTERSPRCAWWVARIEGGWRPNSRIRSLGRDGSIEWYGVHAWEWINVLRPLVEAREN